jgi:hypothetical protein
MGWIQDPTTIEEDNAACVFMSNVEHMTRNIKHIEFTDSWIKVKVADKTCMAHRGTWRKGKSEWEMMY